MHIVFGAAVVFVGALGACGSTPSGFDKDGSASTDAAGDNGFQFKESGGGDAPSCVKCSADLHDVLDCATDAVVQVCPAGEGCGPNGCEAPCDSAKDNKSTVGCDYYSVDPGTDGEANGSCFAAYIANTWDTPATLTVTYNGQALNVGQLARIPSGSGNAITYAPLPNGQLPPGQMAILFLADFVTSVSLPTRCPSGIAAGYTASEASSEQTGIIHSFHITSSVPVVAYDIFPYGGAKSYISSATLLIPSSAWDTNYIAVDCPETENPGGTSLQSPFIEIASATNGTNITLSPTSNIVGGNGVAAVPKGTLRIRIRSMPATSCSSNKTTSSSAPSSKAISRSASGAGIAAPS